MDQSSPSQLEVIRAEAKARDMSDDAVIATDARGTIVYWNHHAELLYGWPAVDAVGRDIVDVTPTRQSAEEAERIMEDLRRGRAWMGMFLVQRRDGTPIVVHVTDLPIRRSGVVIGIVGISRRHEHNPPP